MTGRPAPGRAHRWRRAGALAGAVAILTTAGTALSTPSPAAAAAEPAPESASCGSRVGVLVDFGALGGVRQGCGPTGRAADAVAGAGFDLADHPRQPGFVCRVAGQPADGDCLRPDAYWGLFLAAGSADAGGADEDWRYATKGLYGQQVGPGDAVALVWQDSATRREPGDPVASPTGDPGAEQQDAGAQDADQQDPERQDPEGLPTWLVLGVLAAGFVGAGAAFWLRRSRTPRP